MSRKIKTETYFTICEVRYRGEFIDVLKPVNEVEVKNGGTEMSENRYDRYEDAVAALSDPKYKRDPGIYQIQKFIKLVVNYSE